MVSTVTKQLQEVNKGGAAVLKNLLFNQVSGAKKATRHATIVVPGFLSTESCEATYSTLIDRVGPSKTALFAFEWEASALCRLRQLLENSTNKLGFDINLAMASGGEISLFKYLLLNESSEVTRVFNQCRLQAKLSGKLLACALALGQPFKSQTVSLIGFSLGSQVVKTCVKTLH